MVAYSFQERFVLLIREGYKRQTVRGHRSRHVRPGEILQLYQGMRTKACAKIIADPVCTHVAPIEIILRGRLIERIVIDRPVLLSTPDLDAFAIEDGFESREDMSAFWVRNHPGVTEFAGVLIEWARRPIGDLQGPLKPVFEIRPTDGPSAEPHRDPVFQ